MPSPSLWCLSEQEEAEEEWERDASITATRSRRLTRRRVLDGDEQRGVKTEGDGGPSEGRVVVFGEPSRRRTADEEDVEELSDSDRRVKRVKLTYLVKNVCVVEDDRVVKMSTTSKSRQVDLSKKRGGTYMTEAIARSMVDFSHDAEFDEEEVVDAVEYVRNLLSGHGVTIAYDCSVCYRSLDNHDEARCAEGDRETEDEYIQRQFSRLATGLSMLDDERRRDEKEKMKREIERLKKELKDKEESLGEARAAMVDGIEGEMVAKDILKKMTTSCLAKGDSAEEDDAIKAAKSYFGCEWEDMREAAKSWYEVETPVKQVRGRPEEVVIETDEEEEETENSANWSEKPPFEGIEQRRREGKTMDQLREKFENNLYRSITYAEAKTKKKKSGTAADAVVEVVEEAGTAMAGRATDSETQYETLDDEEDPEEGRPPPREIIVNNDRKNRVKTKSRGRDEARPTSSKAVSSSKSKKEDSAKGKGLKPKGSASKGKAKKKPRTPSPSPSSLSSGPSSFSQPSYYSSISPSSDDDDDDDDDDYDDDVVIVSTDEEDDNKKKSKRSKALCGHRHSCPAVEKKKKTHASRGDEKHASADSKRSSKKKSKSASKKRKRREGDQVENVIQPVVDAPVVDAPVAVVEEDVVILENEEVSDLGVPPGLHELTESGFKLQHTTGGPVCGGFSDMDKVNKLMKLTAEIKFGEKKPNESKFVAYLRHERDFVSCMENISTRDLTMYNIISCFCQKNMAHRAVLDELKKKQCHFTSFTKFLEAYRLKRWPNSKQEGIIEAERCKQRGDEDIENYTSRFETVMTHNNWGPDQQVEWYISGLRNEEVRRQVNMYDYGDERTVEAAKEQAMRFSSLAAVDEELQKRRRVISNQPSGNGNGNGQNKKPQSSVSYVSSGDGWQQSARPSTSGYNNRRGNNSSNNNSGSNNSGSNNNRGSNSTSSANNNSNNNRSSNSNGAGGSGSGGAAVAGASRPAASENHRRKRRAAAWMYANDIRGCLACLRNHRMQDDFSTCSDRCPICSRSFKPGENRHYAAECKFLPTNDNELRRKVRSAQSGN